MKFTVYNDSVFATLLSLVSSFGIPIGLVGLLCGAVRDCIVILLASVAGMALASIIGRRATNRKRMREDELLRQAFQISRGNHDVWWSEVTRHFPAARIDNDLNLTIKIYNASPDRRRTNDFLRHVAPNTQSQLRWTCSRCGSRNIVGQNCACGTTFIF